MKATGIIRRIDDLGRVVIPREIRRTLNIREGDALELYTDPVEKAVCFKRYTPMGEHKETLDNLENWIEEFMYDNRTEARDLVRRLRTIFQEEEREEEEE